MTENERIKVVRKAVNLSLAKFGARLGVGDTAVYKVEVGQSAVTEQMRKLICWEFNVSESWLRTGEGSMYANTEDPIDDLGRRYGLLDSTKVIIRHIAMLPEDVQQRLVDELDAILSEIKAIPKPENLMPETEEDVVEEFRKQLHEEKTAQEKSAASSSTDTRTA